uniref:Uncharacterized protein n=1 Tax=Rhizophagus irregularis (strain DAOM 181602 / DAOM 197198 / MUCL 43194) TaxID=747089 RepID=U9UAZ3_RHIID
MDKWISRCDIIWVANPILKDNLIFLLVKRLIIKVIKVLGMQILHNASSKSGISTRSYTFDRS